MAKKLFITAVFAFVFSLSAAAAPLPKVEPASAGLDAATLALIDKHVEDAIAAKRMPGCVVCIGRTGKIGFLKGYGSKQIVPGPLKTEENTVYDLASLTKVISTTSCLAVLADRGKIDFDAPVSRYLKEFYTPEKVGITVKEVMLHIAGFVPDLGMSEFKDGSEKAKQNILNSKPVRKVNEDFVYSDVSFQVLGYLVEQVSRKPLDVFAKEDVFEPLGMTETTYNPDAELSKRCAATQDRALGKVHDPRAFVTDGVAGHAGLFSTASDLAIFADAMLRISQGKESIFSKKTFEKINKNYLVAGDDYRGLGWDKFSGFSSNRGGNMSPQAFGHGGFTGTAIWIDPALDLYVIFLSNRVHPDGKGSVNALAGQIGEIAVDAVVRDKGLAGVSGQEIKIFDVKGLVQEDVLPGIDVLEKTKYAVLKGKRVGIITNHTGLTKDGRQIPKLLKDSGVKLTAIFTPEHGLTGTEDHSNITDSKDPLTGIPVFSLYGKTRRPTPKMLDNVDVLVFDIQDIGARFYTYITTLLNAMESAAFAGKEFVVLDRPNPIRGDRVEGPVLKAGLERFVGCHLIPVQHGMTVGELALMFNEERKLGLNLTVVPCTNWKRSMDLDETKIPWVNPSPNMKSLTAAYFYPGNGLPEFTNLSVGRGTDIPFEWVGTPWIDKEKFAAALTANAAAAKLEGIKFEPCEFTPPDRQYKGEKCFGAKFVLENRKTFRPVRFGVVLMTTLRQLYPDKWDVKNLDTLLLRDKTKQMILDNKPVAEIEADWQPELDRFMKRREAYLLYQ
ncbi:MAG: DUF1343 domain-containing protein [Planctomycetaceae bacterium]|jgi:uncharacterized protein YbbC (DUF1343 family)/CubicO group peptidase (beta-lactamase class C family)|nr:DUF1343 domain-containing protein [Planctomycetaceae bacterium]